MEEILKLIRENPGSSTYKLLKLYGGATKGTPQDEAISGALSVDRFQVYEWIDALEKQGLIKVSKNSSGIYQFHAI